MGMKELKTYIEIRRRLKLGGNYKRRDKMKTGLWSFKFKYKIININIILIISSQGEIINIGIL